MAEPLTVVIMAAGHGTRMRSSLPKVLHPVCGRPMLHWVIAAAREAGATDVVCVTRPGEGVAEALPEGARAVDQTEGEGTGSAVLAAREALAAGGTAVILSGDHPLVSPDLVGRLAAACAGDVAAALLTTEELDPAGYGRIVRAGDGSVERIVETKRTEGVPDEVLAIREVNIGSYAFDAGELVSALEDVEEADGERYLTDVFPILTARGRRIAATRTDDTAGAIGVNTRADLMAVEAQARRRILEHHALAGVSFEAPESVVVEVGVEIGAETTIGTGVTLRGATRIGAGCAVGPHTTVIDSTLGDEVTVPHSYLTECEVADGATVGPFAYLRPGAAIGAGAKVGTYVEVKNSTIGAGAKVPHLSYVGDADVGDGANLGASTITANYDGRRKHRTKIGAGARTGVHTSLVAPVAVGDDAYTGAGSVISTDVPDGALGIARPEQRNVEGFAERTRSEEPPE